VQRAPETGHDRLKQVGHARSGGRPSAADTQAGGAC